MVTIEKFRYINGTLDILVKVPSRYEGYYLTKVEVCDSTTYSTQGKVVFPESEEYDPDVLQQTEFSISNTLDYFNIEQGESLIILKVEVGGDIPVDLPCNDSPKSEAAILILDDMYKYAISFIKDMQNDCSKIGPFNDFMMRYKAVELAVKSCDINNAVNYYNMFFGENRLPNEVTYPYSYDARGQIISGGCGCGHY